MEGHDIYLLQDARCLSCGTVEDFCKENTDHVCEQCFKEKILWRTRRARQFEIDLGAKRAMAKSQAELNEKYSTLLAAFNELSQNMAKIVDVNKELKEQVAIMNLNLDTVVASNTALVKEIAELKKRHREE